MNPTSVAKWAGFGLIAFLAVAIALISMQYLAFDPTAMEESLRKNILDHPIPLFIHTTFAPLVLLVGIWQFLPVTRRSRYHRWAGRVYVAFVMIASISGFIVAFTTTAGPIVAASFVMLAVLWFSTTLYAYLLARGGRYPAHRRWMIRSYAFTCAGILLRVLLIIGLSAGLPFVEAYFIAGVGCWLPNIIIAEILIRRLKQPQMFRPAARPKVATAV